MWKHWNRWNLNRQIQHPWYCWLAHCQCITWSTWAAVTSWVFPREKGDKHETSPQCNLLSEGVEQVFKHLYLTQTSRKKPGTAQVSVVDECFSLQFGNWLNQQTTMAGVKTNALSFQLLWTNLILLIHNTWSAGWTPFFFPFFFFLLEALCKISSHSDPLCFHSLSYRSGVTLFEAKAFMEHNIIL